MTTIQDIQATIDQDINPLIKLHNGFCKAIAIENGVLTVDLQGGCVGCPSSRITLYQGILPVLQEKHPEILDLQLA